MSQTIEVLLTQSFHDNLIVILREVSPSIKIVVHKAKKADDVPDEAWEKAEVLYTSVVLPEPEQAPNLRWIQFHWTGINHGLDAAILQKPGLVATTLSGMSAGKVAEHVLMLMLALSLRLPDMLAHQARSEWPEDRWRRFSPRELHDSTVGIVGYGSIGRQVARLLHAFGAKVLACKRNALQPEDTGFIVEGHGDPHGDYVQRLYPFQAVRSMVKECDFVVVTVPLTSQTRGLIDQDVFKSMKSSAFLVDVSRGDVVDQSALIEALEEKEIAGAGLDVFPEEPPAADNPLWKMPNVIITPHMAGVTPRYDERAITFFAENLRRYLAGEQLYNQIDLEKGY